MRTGKYLNITKRTLLFEYDSYMVKVLLSCRKKSITEYNRSKQDIRTTVLLDRKNDNKHKQYFVPTRHKILSRPLVFTSADETWLWRRIKVVYDYQPLFAGGQIYSYYGNDVIVAHSGLCKPSWTSRKYISRFISSFASKLCLRDENHIWTLHVAFRFIKYTKKQVGVRFPNVLLEALQTF